MNTRGAERANRALHHVSSVLESVIASAHGVAGQIDRSEVTQLAQLANLLHEHHADLGHFLTSDPTGQRVVGWLVELSNGLAKEQRETMTGLSSLCESIDRILTFIALEQAGSQIPEAKPPHPVTLVLDGAPETPAKVRNTAPRSRPHVSSIVNHK